MTQHNIITRFTRNGMEYSAALLSIFSVLFALYAAVVAFGYVRKRQRDRRLASMPFPARYRRHLLGIPHYRLLEADAQAKVERAVLRFIATKTFVPIEMEMTDEIRSVVAFYAALMVLAYEGYDYPLLKTIYVYTHDFVLDEIYSDGGIYTEERVVLEGQSTGEAIVLSWEKARQEAYHAGRYNVIVHEFAHALDMQDGYADGVPPIDEAPRHWAQRMQEEYDAFAAAVSRGRYLGDYALIDAYGAQNEAEFFAVLSELYFMRPHLLKLHFPALYMLLTAFYKLDTAKMFAAVQ